LLFAPNPNRFYVQVTNILSECQGPKTPIMPTTMEQVLAKKLRIKH
jgi:hypothetical protein